MEGKRKFRPVLFSCFVLSQFRGPSYLRAWNRLLRKEPQYQILKDHIILHDVYFKQNAFLRSWTYAVFYGCLFFFLFMLLYAITLRVIYINTDQLLTGFYYDKPGSPPPPPLLFLFYFLARSTRFVIKSNVICKNSRICNKNQLNMQ